MKHRWWLACLLAAGVATAQTTDETALGAHDARHAQAPPVDPFRKAVVPPREKQKQGVPPAYERQWRAAMAMEDTDAAATGRALAQAMEDPGFQRLDPRDQRATWSQAAWMAIRDGALPRARDLLLRALDAGSDDIDDYYLLAQVEAESDRPGKAAEYLARIVERWPAQLDDLESGVVFRIAHAASAASGERRRLLEALFAIEWDNRGLGVGKLWYELALLRLEAGDTGGVQAAIERSDAPEALIGFRTDRRFDPWVDRQDARFDVALAARQRVERLRRVIRDRPDLLEARMELGYALLTVGDDEDVIALSDDTMAIIRAAEDGSPPFRDMQYQPWILDNRASARVRLGRWDEAISDLQEATRLEERGQSLNLANLLCDLGRTREAKAALALPAQPTPYGERVAASVRHCIAVQDHDKAARHVRNALADPESLPVMLAALQSYRAPPPLPGDRAVSEGWRALEQRPDVLRAVDRVGRIEAFDIHSPYGY